MKPVPLLLCLALTISAQLIPDELLRDILHEVSAENALKETAAIAARSRYPNSQSFLDAAEAVAERARAYGLANVRIERFRESTPLWDPVEAELEILAPATNRLRSTLADQSLLLAQNSAAGDLTAALVTEDGDVRGKAVLTDLAPKDAWPALQKRGAAAIVSAYRPQYFGRRPALNAIAWEETPPDALAFMISPEQGNALREQIACGPVQIRLHARTRTSSPGYIAQVMGEIPGEIAGRDIVIAAHLDHQKQGANDNASGAGTLLEVLRTLQKLKAEKKIAPRRTIRFWWTTEIHSEERYFAAHRDEARKILAAIVLDQAGGDRHAENNFIAIYGPEWLPAYTDDLIYDLGEQVHRDYAPTEHQPDPLSTAPGGSTQSMRMDYWNYLPLSDHSSFEAREVRIPAIALAVPSLHVIHTNLDTVDRLDPTWLKRSALMTLAPALYLAGAGATEIRSLADLSFRRAAARISTAPDPKEQLAMEIKRLESLHALDPSLNLAPYRDRLNAVAKAVYAR